MRGKLNFIVIGAAKSATTSLYALLKDHPEIYIPKAKEVPFFSDEAVYKRGANHYFNSYFQNADKNKLWGTVTPQYMIDGDTVSVEKIAKRIHDAFPDTKIVALLRNPAERSFSHYKMQVQRGVESRSFKSIVNDTVRNPEYARKNEASHESYIFTSEYGRILEVYYSLFPKENIFVATTDELKDNPAEVIRQLCSFIGVDSTYIPANLSKRHREGGSRPRFKFLTPGFLYSIPFVEKFWKTKAPAVLRKKVEYTINLWNTKKDNLQLSKDSGTYRKLMSYFKEDTEKVQRLTGKQLPWGAENQTGESSSLLTAQETS